MWCDIITYTGRPRESLFKKKNPQFIFLLNLCSLLHIKKFFVYLQIRNGQTWSCDTRGVTQNR